MWVTGKRYTDDFKKMIVEAYNTGKPMKEICEEYDVTYVTVNNWVNKLQPKAKVSEKPIINSTFTHSFWDELLSVSNYSVTSNIIIYISLVISNWNILHWINYSDSGNIVRNVAATPVCNNNCIFSYILYL